jgi:hypothetical protein
MWCAQAPTALREQPRVAGETERAVKVVDKNDLTDSAGSDSMAWQDA